jgi:hypothetical protein
MDWGDLLIYTAVAVAGITGGFVLVHLAWRIDGSWRIHRAGPRHLRANRHRIWRQPSAGDLTDLRFGPGGAEGAPVPPFRFVEEHFAGSQPCVSVRDARGRLWRVKWGHEVRPETFAVRFAWALGFFAEVTHYVATGTIDGAVDVQRARNCVEADGTFHDARFELEDPDVRMFFDEHSWAWNDNPFLGTPELNGLKIVVMLLSNWDTKDRRDVSRGSNTAIFELRGSHRTRVAQYLITDWGGAMGKWGSNLVSRDRWDPDGFEAQTPGFVTGVTDGFVCFGYQGQRTAEIARNITVNDVAWFYATARQLTEKAIHGGLVASGATDDEAARFARALTDRIRQLGDACGAAEEPRRTIKAG